MSAMAKTGRVTGRYLWAKALAARDAVLNELSGSSSSSSSASHSSGMGMPTLFEMFREAYGKQLTTVIAVTGAAMAPAINPDGAADPSAFEKLVVRLIPRPSPRTVSVGDVVAFSSPLAPASPHSLMVRRVAALEGHAMLSGDDEAFSERVPPGHCWVLADNEELAPPEVIDSRVFGYLDLRLVMGRVIYRARSPKQHGPVANSPQSEPDDQAVLEGEVDVDELAGSMPAEPQ